MRKRILFLIVSLTAFMLVSCGKSKSSSQEEYAASSSIDETDPAAYVPADGYIHISTAQEFLAIADDLDGKYILDTDINDWQGGQSTVFKPIGTAEKPFTGELNGNGHTITGTLEYSGQNPYFGFFGCNEGTIHDLVIGTVRCNEMEYRYNNSWDTGLPTYTSLFEDSLPVEKTQYFGVLCAVNRGTIEHVTYVDYSYYPDYLLYPNENEKIYIGMVCGYNDGTVSGVTMNSPYSQLSTAAKDTAVDIGAICGYQTANGKLENVSLTETGVRLYYYGENLCVAAPAVYAGVLVGEAEGGTTIGQDIHIISASVDTCITLMDADLRLGGLIGYVNGDIELSGIEVDDLSVDADGYTDVDGYIPVKHNPYAGGGLIGWADGNVTLSNIRMNDITSHMVRRKGGDPDMLYASDVIAYCGGDVSAHSVTAEGNVNAASEQGIACAGCLCGYCSGSGQIEDCHISILMNPVFNGSVLYQAIGFGYLCSDASFKNTEIDCGTDKETGEARSISFVVASDKTYYLASLAGAAKGTVTAENCVIDVVYNLFGTPGAVYGGGKEGNYNTVR